MATIPGPATPNKAYASKQLDTFEKVLNRLERGVPKVPLRTDTGQTSTSPSPNIPAGGGRGNPGNFSYRVTVGGMIHSFPTKQALDEFKAAAGIR